MEHGTGKSVLLLPAAVIVRSFSPVAKQLYSFSGVSGLGNWTIDSLRSYGLFMKIGLQSDLLTNGTMIVATGFDPTGMRIGNLTATVSWPGVWRVSTICQFARRIANTVGRSVVVLMNIPGSQNLVYKTCSASRLLLLLSVYHVGRRLTLNPGRKNDGYN